MSEAKRLKITTAPTTPTAATIEITASAATTAPFYSVRSKKAETTTAAATEPAVATSAALTAAGPFDLFFIQ